MDFVDKKERLADMLESLIREELSSQDFFDELEEYKIDPEFKDKPLFQTIFKELDSFFDELTPKDLKQRVSFIRSYLD